MRKILLTFTALAVMLTASAEGYQVNNFSARQSGMAQVGTGMSLGAESVWFNPAAVVMQSSILDISAGFTGIASKVDFRNGDYATTTDNSLSTPIHIYASVRPIKWLAVGLAFNTPHGSSLDWDDNWAGAHLCQDIALKQYNLQPTLSIRLGEKWSLGAGLMLSWGNFEMSKSLLPVGGATNAFIEQMSGMAGIGSMIGNNALASIEFEGNARPTVGFNIGAFWNVSKIFSMGISYRHSMKMKVDNGEASLDFIDNDFGRAAEMMLGQFMGLSNELLGSSYIRTELPTPGVISLGVSLHPIKIITIAADLQYNLWSVYDEMRMYLVTPNGEMELTNDVIAAKDYKNTFTARLGAEVSPFGWFAARAGIYFDESPVRNGMLSPETPSMSKMGVTAGVSLRFLKMINLDLAYGYVSPINGGRTDSTKYVDMFTQQVAEFGGTYKASAHTFSVGVRLTF